MGKERHTQTSHITVIPSGGGGDGRNVVSSAPHRSRPPRPRGAAPEPASRLSHLRRGSISSSRHSSRLSHLLWI